MVMFQADEIPDVEATFTVRGPPAQVSQFRKLLTAIDVMCLSGASRTIRIEVDGDGATQLELFENGQCLTDTQNLDGCGPPHETGG